MTMQILENVIDRTTGPISTFQPREIVERGLKTIPYQAVLCLKPLVAIWRDKLDSEDYAERLLAREIVEYADRHEEIVQSGIGCEELTRHQDFVDLLMAGCFPLNKRELQLGKACAPFSMQEFYLTPAFRRLKNSADLCYSTNRNVETFFTSMLVEVCSVILNRFYGQNIEVEPQLVISMRPPSGGITRHFKSDQVLRFFDIELLQPLPEISQEQINELLSNIYDRDRWLELLPPDHFLIHGMMAINMIEVTAEETLSRLKFQLLERDAVVYRKNIREQERILESYFNLPGLRLGLTALDYPREYQIDHQYRIRHDILADTVPNLLEDTLGNTVHRRACHYNEVLLVEDLEALPHKTKTEQDLLAAGIRSLLVAPLHNKEGRIIGLLEIGAEQPYGINSFMELKLRDVRNLFSVALERSRLEVDNQIESIIREQFTAVHPSVEWKFIETAYDILLQQERQGQGVKVPPIRFENVYPLYAQSDIVASSTQRNEAIQHDFIENLDLALEFLRFAMKRVDLPILHQYIRRIEEVEAQLQDHGITSTDETQTMSFIKEELHPLFQELKNHGKDIAAAADNYFTRLDSEFEIIYDQRKNYEESVQILNDEISRFLDMEESRTQRMMPHYFEKYKTDGVEYNIYLGDSLLKNGGFSKTYLKNLRLWQLISTAEIARRVRTIQERMPIPLETAQLIFVYSSPLTIVFRRDEKRFDVDGSYNVRYEIIKKRIDKAYIKGTTERLTQAGKIAIVYTDDATRDEYLQYLNYLIAEGFIEEEIEQLELNPMQGVHGLRALRVGVV